MDAILWGTRTPQVRLVVRRDPRFFPDVHKGAAVVLGRCVNHVHSGDGFAPAYVVLRLRSPEGSQYERTTVGLVPPAREGPGALRHLSNIDSESPADRALGPHVCLRRAWARRGPRSVGLPDLPTPLTRNDLTQLKQTIQ